ncbi:MAG: hypothetical protein CMM74_08505 [Rhodospirillaceae bacterium]|nr:hypothetical protein [Rhodospirillaceae bacterium]
MFTMGALSFVAPAALLGLAFLPVLWWLLRVIPPAPKRLRFPAIRLVMKLVNPEEESAKTPLWLILLRLAILVLIIVGAAHPIFNAGSKMVGSGPLVLVVDDGWTAAQNWRKRQTIFANLVDQAERKGRPVSVITTAPVPINASRDPAGLMTADAARRHLGALQPKPWPVNRQAASAILSNLNIDAAANVFWLSDGIKSVGKDEDLPAFINELKRLGKVTIVAEPPAEAPLILMPPVSERAGLKMIFRRLERAASESWKLLFRDEKGGVLAQRDVTIGGGSKEGTYLLKVPVELRNRITQIEIQNQNTAGATVLVDERWRRRPVGLVSAIKRSGDQPLLDNLYYLDRALDPFTEVRVDTIKKLLRRELSLMVLADPGKIGKEDRKDIARWMADGGVAVRFAGPNLGSKKGLAKDPFLPVRLRQGDRELGGALSWSKPARFAAFDEKSPFAGISIPGDVLIHRQVLAQPAVDLAEKTWARLTDGTPLVTAEKHGRGWLVFFHITASPAWSNLPLSGLFVSMMQNLVQMSRGITGNSSDKQLKPIQSIDGFGRLGPAHADALAIKGNEFMDQKPGPYHPPGFYGDTAARRAFNLSSSLGLLASIGGLDSGIDRTTYQISREKDYRGQLLTAALVLAILDIIASLALRGYFTMARATAILITLSLGIGSITPVTAQQQNQPVKGLDDLLMSSTLKIRLAYVRTGNRQIDETSFAGLSGLAFVTNSRTAADMGRPIAIDPATDELSYYPLIYWPINEDAEIIGATTAARLNLYLKSGGTILFDTRDQGSSGINADRLEEITRNLDLPAMTAIPSDHVLTKAYYLLREFPGRWTGGRLWVESLSGQSGGASSGGRVNDGVSSIIVGANDWAAAWALNDARKPLYPAVPGGERQREMAYRFGINLMMYVLTGNYKADQVHLPAILERLGQ